VGRGPAEAPRTPSSALGEQQRATGEAGLRKPAPGLGTASSRVGWGWRTGGQAGDAAREASWGHEGGCTPGCASLGGRVSPTPPIHSRRDGNHPFTSVRAQGTFPKWPIRHPVSGGSTSIKRHLLTLLPGQWSCSQERREAARGAGLSPGQRAASVALSGGTEEADKFGDAPMLLGGLDAEPCCGQSCARLPAATSRPRLDRAKTTHNHPCSSPGHPSLQLIHASSSHQDPPALGAAACSPHLLLGTCVPTEPC